MRPRILDMLFNDDRMFVLEILPVEMRDSTSIVLDLSPLEKPDDRSCARATREWAVVTRRNVAGYPPHRTDTFPSKAEAVSYYKRVVVETPRVSTDQRTPNPIPSIGEYTKWLKEGDLSDPVLNPKAARSDA